ncbi:MAG: hypothetical protein KDA05_01380 [Phycisphaerales bacterium]|nr:hypothetical protein [Phycisphaerales bacterium]
MILDDAPSIRAALATMNPMARTATQVLAQKLLEHPALLNDNEQIKKQALYACAAAFVDAGWDLERDEQRFASFIEDHGANVLDLAASIVLCMARDHQRRKVWGNVGKVAALVGAAALGAFFG